MSIYNKQKVKELAEIQLKKDLTSFDGELINVTFNLTDDEFKRFWLTFQTSDYHNTSDFFKHWKFYISDDVSEYIIFENEDLKKMYCEPYDFMIDECLEEAKSQGIIKGFIELGNDLWIINNKSN